MDDLSFAGFFSVTVSESNRPKQTSYECLKYSVLTVVNMSMVFSWVVMLCALINAYQRFGGIFLTTYKTTWHHNQKSNNEKL
jgi:hypothetical protein